MYNIKRCPFCRGEADVDDNVTEILTRWYFVRCDECGAEGPWDEDEGEAVAMWNRRYKC